MTLWQRVFLPLQRWIPTPAAGQAYRVSFAVKTTGEMKYRAGRGAAKANHFGASQRYRLHGRRRNTIGFGVTQPRQRAESNVIGSCSLKKSTAKPAGSRYSCQFSCVRPRRSCRMWSGNGWPPCRNCRSSGTSQRFRMFCVFRGGLFGSGNMPVQGYALDLRPRDC